MSSPLNTTAVRLAAALILTCLSGLATFNPAIASDIETKVIAMVDKAIETYKVRGAEAFPEMSNPKGEYRDGEVYLFVTGPKKVRAHAGNPNFVGSTAIIYDWDGSDLNQRLRDTATESGAWATYHLANPANGQIEHKRSWVRLHDQMVFGAGYYNGR